MIQNDPKWFFVIAITKLRMINIKILINIQQESNKDKEIH